MGGVLLFRLICVCIVFVLEFMIGLMDVLFVGSSGRLMLLVSV